MESIFLDRKLAHEKLKEYPPTHIAVAYVGRDWDELVDCSQLQEIIVSPTLGTNPRAVAEIAEQIGWDHVHFLDELHAKIYLSQSCCIWGSFNLSNNAFGQKSSTPLFEAGTHSKEAHIIRDAYAFFEELQRIAHAQYPNHGLKIKKLSELHGLHNNAIANKFTNTDTLKENLDELPKYNHSYVISFSYGEAQFNKEAIKQKIKKQKIPDCKSLPFTEQDANFLHKGSWILVYSHDDYGVPVEKCSKDNFYWIYVHDLIMNGYQDTSEFPLVAFQWIDEDSIVPPEPFKLTTKIYTALKTTLQDSRFKHFSELDDDAVWNLRDGNTNIEKFVDVWRENLAKVSN
jgi:hypothetical protein